MALSEDDVRHIAELARLGLSDVEVKKFTVQLSNVLEYVEQLNEVDTSTVEPTSQVTGLTNVSREDAVQPKVTREELLACSPLSIVDHQIQVKSVFEE